jgi:hypothetical protein
MQVVMHAIRVVVIGLYGAAILATALIAAHALAIVAIVGAVLLGVMYSGMAVASRGQSGGRQRNRQRRPGGR